jgi:hypothetical protein
MNLFNSQTLISILFGRAVERYDRIKARRQPTRHPGSKPPRLSKAGIRAGRKAQRQARKRQRGVA